MTIRTEREIEIEAAMIKYVLTAKNADEYVARSRRTDASVLAELVNASKWAALAEKARKELEGLYAMAEA